MAWEGTQSRNSTSNLRWLYWNWKWTHLSIWGEKRSKFSATVDEYQKVSWLSVMISWSAVDRTVLKGWQWGTVSSIILYKQYALVHSFLKYNEQLTSADGRMDDQFTTRCLWITAHSYLNRVVFYSSRVTRHNIFMAVRWQLPPSTNYSKLNIRYTVEANQYYERSLANLVEYIPQNGIKNN